MPREPAKQDMYLDIGSNAESVVGQAEPMDGQAEEMVDQGGPGWTRAWKTNT